MSPLPDSVFDQITQAITSAVWNRPELTWLREPVQKAFEGNTFAALTQQAFTAFAAQSATDLPRFFDAGFIGMPAVQSAIAVYVTRGDPLSVDELADLYAKRFLVPGRAPDVKHHLTAFLTPLREAFAADPKYGPILLARDVQSMAIALNNLRDEMQTGFGAVFERFDKLLKEPEIKALVERKSGSHVFLSYSRQNLALALKVRHALEAAGHVVWQDTTAIKGGQEWIESIEDGIERAYAVVTLVSAESKGSNWVNLEFLHAQRRNKLIVPLKIDDCEIPITMLLVNVVSGHPDLDGGVRGVIAALPSMSTIAAAPAPAPKRDQRQREIDYLDGLLLEHSVWQTVYTPMAGVARLSQTPAKREVKRAVATIKPLFSALQKEIQTAFAEAPQMIEESFEDITQAVNKVRHLVVLGDPGAGKSTTLWKLAADYAEAAKQDPTKPLPVLLKLGAMEKAVSVRNQLQTQLGDLSFDDLLRTKRVALLFDALNELPDGNRAANVTSVRELVQLAQRDDLIAVVTCRELDYNGDLDLGITERVQIAPLDPVRIRQFCHNHLPDDGEELFWQIAGGAAVRDAWDAWVRAGATFEIFWTADDILRENPNVYGDTTVTQDEAWRRARQDRSMMALARNPYLLFMMTEVFAEKAALPENRGKLFETFVAYLLREREKLAPAEADALIAGLSELAFAMQREGRGTSVDRAIALRYLSDEALRRAVSASLLDGQTTVRFTHQLLQEYFAARRLQQDLRSHVPATTFFPAERWWEPQGWEETAILLGGLYSDDCTPVLNWLRDAQPELTARCVQESGAYTPPETLVLLRQAWKPRLTDLESDPEPKARAAIGRAVGRLRLDDRLGVGWNPVNSHLSFDWVTIPAGEFWMGIPDGVGRDNERPRHRERVGAYRISRYPVTVAQFEPFVAGDGYTNDAYWTEAGRKWREATRQPAYWHYPKWHIANHPVVGVSWYEAYAYCQWLTAQLKANDPSLLPEQWIVRLPTEAEWERAARANTEQTYPYPGAFDAAKGNVSETQIGRTSAVGIFPNGASPDGLMDMSGNVYEWCQTKWRSDYRVTADDQAEGTSNRLLRGGSWSDARVSARAGYRLYYYPSNRDFNVGFRVVVVLRPPSLNH